MDTHKKMLTPQEHTDCRGWEEKMTSNPTHQQGVEWMRTAQDRGQSHCESKETDSGASSWDVMSDRIQEDLLL